MRLLRVKLTDVRGVETAEVRFAPEGVTVVAAPNEAGKSTLLEAVDVLLTYPDSSRAQPVRDLQPAERDVPSTIEVELTCGATHLTCVKTFNRERATVLTVHAPSRDTLRGADAHHRLRGILDRDVDEALADALRFGQGRALEPVALGGSGVLAACLDEAAGGAGAVDDGGLLERASAVAARWFTPTGRPGRRLQVLARACSEAEATHERLAARATELEAATAELLAIERDLPAVRRRRSLELLPRLAAARDREGELARARATVDGRRAEHAEAKATRERLEAEHRTREELRQSDEALASERQRRRAKLAPLEARLDELVPRRDELDRALHTTTGRAEECRREWDAAQRRVDLLLAVEERDRLAGCLERIATVQGAAGDAERALAELRIDDARLRAIRVAAEERRVALATLAAAAPSVALRAEGAISFVLDDETRTLQAGDTLAQQLGDSLSLRVPDVVELEVRAGTSAAKLQRAVDDAEARLREICQDAGVPDPEAAEELAEQRRRQLETVRRGDIEIARELAGRSHEEVFAALRAANERIVDVRAAMTASERSVGPVSGVPADAAAAATDDAASRRAPVTGRSRSARSASASATMQLPLFGDGRDRDPGDDTSDAELVGGLDDARRQLAAARDRAEAAMSASSSARAARDDILATIATLETQLGVARTAQLACEQRHDDVLARLDAARRVCDDDTLATALTAARDHDERMLRALTAARDELDVLDPERIDAEVAELVAELAALDRQVRDLEQRQTRLHERLRLGGDEGLGERLQDARNVLERARLDHRREAARAAAARLLVDELTAARERAYRAFRDPLQRSIDAQVRALLGDDVEVLLDDDLRIVGRVRGGVPLAWAQLSAGAREQLAVIAALAAAQLAGRDGVPLILDDALGYTDPDRLAGLGRLLGQTDDAQVIVLTCVADRFRHVAGARTVQLRSA
jgi:NACalpha-BTF3-like transcription factor